MDQTVCCLYGKHQSIVLSKSHTIRSCNCSRQLARKKETIRVVVSGVQSVWNTRYGDSRAMNSSVEVSGGSAIETASSTAITATAWMHEDEECSHWLVTWNQLSWCLWWLYTMFMFGPSQPLIRTITKTKWLINNSHYSHCCWATRAIPMMRRSSVSVSGWIRKVCRSFIYILHFGRCLRIVDLHAIDWRATKCGGHNNVGQIVCASHGSAKEITDVGRTSPRSLDRHEAPQEEAKAWHIARSGFALSTWGWPHMLEAPPSVWGQQQLHPHSWSWYL